MQRRASKTQTSAKTCYSGGWLSGYWVKEKPGVLVVMEAYGGPGVVDVVGAV
jgi:hypothetical protein